MSLFSFMLLSLAIGYAILPYAFLYLAFRLRTDRLLTSGDLMRAALAGVAAFCFAAPALTSFNFDIYQRFHAMAAVGSVALLAFALLRRRHTPLIDRKSFCFGPFILLFTLALIVRMVPLLLAQGSLGGDDARFHNIIASRILQERTLAATWEPFAHIPVFYPQGSHVFMAFVAECSGRPVHEALNALIAWVGWLTTGAICLLAMAIFRDRRSAVWAAASYAFLALWGSLDYFRWAGLPNALGMLLLCLIVLTLIEGLQASPRARPFGSLGAALIFAAICFVHYYTLWVGGIVLGCAFVFAGSRDLRVATLQAALGGLLFCLPLLVLVAVAMGKSSGATSLFVFREAPLTLLDCLIAINPILAVLACGVLFLARRLSWNTGQLLSLAWLAGLLVAFSFCEYVYRAISLLVTHGADCYVCLTPSRLATDLVYPLCLLIGFMPLLPGYASRERMAVFLLGCASAITCVPALWAQRHVGVYPEFRAAGDWVRQNTPSNAMVVGFVPYMEYLGQRETSHPPLPASEARRNPYVTWKTGITSFQDWLIWENQFGRPVYFLMPTGSRLPPDLKKVYANDKVCVMVARRKEAHGTGN